METSTIAIIICAITLILFLIERVPFVVTAILAMVAMAITGVISYEDAFAGFSNVAVLLVIGTMMMSAAFSCTGLSDNLGNLLYRFVGDNEKRFMIALYVLASIMGIFLSGLVLMAVFMPIIDIIVVKTKGKISRKHTYLLLAIATVIGGDMSAFTSSSMINASGILYASGYGRYMTPFEPLAIGGPIFLATLVFYLTVGYKYQIKTLDFEEAPVTSIQEVSETDKKDYNPVKKWLAAIIMIAAVIGFIIGPNMAMVAFVAVILLILTGCMDVKSAFRAVSWETVIVVASCLGFSKGLELSGAAQIIAEAFIDLCGPIGESPYGMCVIMLLLGTLISNFMSNNAAVAMNVPVAIAMAHLSNADPMAFVMASAIGCNISFSTPVCVPVVTMTTSVGYRFKHYFKVGGMCNLIAFVVGAIMLKLVYFM